MLLTEEAGDSLGPAVHIRRIPFRSTWRTEGTQYYESLKMYVSVWMYVSVNSTHLLIRKRAQMASDIYILG